MGLRSHLMRMKQGCEREMHPGWGILTCGMWVRSWYCVPNPQKTCPSPCCHTKAQGKDCAKSKVLSVLSASWTGCIPHPGSTSQPLHLCPTGEIKGTPVFASPLINNHNYQPSQANCCLAVFCMAAAESRGAGPAEIPVVPSDAVFLQCRHRPFVQAHPISSKHPSNLTESNQD